VVQRHSHPHALLGHAAAAAAAPVTAVPATRATTAAVISVGSFGAPWVAPSSNPDGAAAAAADPACHAALDSQRPGWVHGFNGADDTDNNWSAGAS